MPHSFTHVYMETHKVVNLYMWVSILNRCMFLCLSVCIYHSINLSHVFYRYEKTHTLSVNVCVSNMVVQSRWTRKDTFFFSLVRARLKSAATCPWYTYLYILRYISCVVLNRSLPSSSMLSSYELFWCHDLILPTRYRCSFFASRHPLPYIYAHAPMTQNKMSTQEPSSSSLSSKSWYFHFHVSRFSLFPFHPEITR